MLCIEEIGGGHGLLYVILVLREYNIVYRLYQIERRLKLQLK